MFDSLASRVADGGPAMYPLLLLAVVGPLVALTLYFLGVVLQNKAWALRFAVLDISVGVVVPLASWAGSVWRMRSQLDGLRGQLSTDEFAAVEFAARAQMLALPQAALFSAPWLLACGFALLGVALWAHPALAKKG